MAQRKKYFLLNTGPDFRRRPGKQNVYYSRLLDSREKQMVWHRMQVMGMPETGNSPQIWVYASEKRKILVRGVFREIEDAIGDQELNDAELEAAMENDRQAVLREPEDVLLHQICGRYLWIRIELAHAETHAEMPLSIKIAFPKETWLKYLPEIYEEDKESASFLERYLGIFQSLYEEMTEKIEEDPVFLNPWIAEEEKLHGIAQWLGVERTGLWNERQLRYLTSNAVEMYRYRGTTWFMKELLKLYTGKEPYIVERHQLEPFFDGASTEQKLKRLYSNHAYEFTVLLDAEGLKTDNRDSSLRQVVDMAKPAGTECRIVMLKPYIFLGQYSYLGINSVLGQYKAFELNGLCAVPFTTVDGREGKGRKHQ